MPQPRRALILIGGPPTQPVKVQHLGRRCLQHAAGRRRGLRLSRLGQRSAQKQQRFRVRGWRRYAWRRTVTASSSRPNASSATRQCPIGVEIRWVDRDVSLHVGRRRGQLAPLDAAGGQELERGRARRRPRQYGTMQFRRLVEPTSPLQGGRFGKQFLNRFRVQGHRHAAFIPAAGRSAKLHSSAAAAREKKRRFLAEPPPMYRTICSN